MPEFETKMKLALPTPSKLFTPAVTTILILMVIGYALAMHLETFTANFLAINTPRLFRGMVWQLITYSFINVCTLNLVFNGLVVLFIGSAIEREWKTRSFIILWLIVSVTCGLIWALVNLVFGLRCLGIGTGACAYGIIAAFGLVFRHQRFLAYFWALEAQHLAWIVIAIGLIVGIARPISWIWVGGALVAYLYIKFKWRIKSGSKSKSTEISDTIRNGFVDID